jgi:hypothetical protein
VNTKLIMGIRRPRHDLAVAGSSFALHFRNNIGVLIVKHHRTRFQAGEDTLERCDVHKSGDGTEPTTSELNLITTHPITRSRYNAKPSRSHGTKSMRAEAVGPCNRLHCTAYLLKILATRSSPTRNPCHELTVVADRTRSQPLSGSHLAQRSASMVSDFLTQSRACTRGESRAEVRGHGPNRYLNLGWVLGI